MELYRVVTGYLVAGVEVEDDVVVRAAPILKWSVGKPLAAVYDWIARKGGCVQRIVGGPDAQ